MFPVWLSLSLGISDYMLVATWFRVWVLNLRLEFSLQWGGGGGRDSSPKRRPKSVEEETKETKYIKKNWESCCFNDHGRCHMSC